jgi:hypothetical protein
MPDYLGVIDRYVWPYHSINKSTVTLIPKSTYYPRVVLVEEQEIGGSGMTDNWPNWTNSASVPPPGCRRWKMTVSVSDRQYPPECVLDLLNLEVIPPGQYVPRAGSIDRTDVLNLVEAYYRSRYGIDIPVTVDATERNALLRETTEVAAIIQECQEPRDGLTSNYPQLKGKLDYIVRSRKQKAGEQAYPFGDHTAAETSSVGPIFYIHWLGIPLALVVWLSGCWLLRSSPSRSLASPPNDAAPAARSLLGQFLTYFWTQPAPVRSLPHEGANAGSGAAVVNRPAALPEVPQTPQRSPASFLLWIIGGVALLGICLCGIGSVLFAPAQGTFGSVGASLGAPVQPKGKAFGTVGASIGPPGRPSEK